MEGLPPSDPVKPLFLNEDLTSMDPNANFSGSMMTAPGPPVLVSQAEYCGTEASTGTEVGHVEAPAKDSIHGLCVPGEASQITDPVCGHNFSVVVKQILDVPVVPSADAESHQVTDSGANPVTTVMEATPMDSGGGPGGAVESCPVGLASIAEEPADLPRAPDDDQISMKAPEDGSSSRRKPNQSDLRRNPGRGEGGGQGNPNGELQLLHPSLSRHPPQSHLPPGPPLPPAQTAAHFPLEAAKKIQGETPPNTIRVTTIHQASLPANP